MTNDIKVGDVLHRITDYGLGFTKGKDYKVTKASSAYITVNDDSGWGHNLSIDYVTANFTVIRETPQFVRDVSAIKVGSLVRVVKAKPDETDPEASGYYENGDIFEVMYLWRNGGGITTTQGIEMFFSEVEKVSESDPLVKLDQAIYSPGVSNDAVNQPSHYTNGKFETIEIIEEITKGYKDGFIAYDIGNVTKYLARAPYKHDTPLEDLRKAERYLGYAIKRQEELEG